jgi:glycerophosphoryl diester phosphodiesterase
MDNPPIIVAHRGLHAQYPENSLAAFRAAWEAGLDWCECDVHAASDGVPVVIHDDTLDRTTTLSGPVAAMSSGALAGVIPTLRQVIEAMPGGGGLMVEIKPPDQALVNIVLDQTRGIRCVIQSFAAQNLRWARQYQPAAELVLLVENETALAAADEHWTAVHVEHRLLQSPAVAELHRRGVKIGAWTVNTRDDVLRAARFGAYAIITDDPMMVGAAALGR